MSATVRTPTPDTLPEGVYVTSEATLKGSIYCCPGCGRGCTYTAYRHAVREAQKLIKRLGPGWVARVWDNLGWNYSAELADARLTVSVSTHKRKTTYHAYLHHLANEGGGIWVATHDDAPEAAIQQVLDAAKREIDEKVLGVSAVRLALEKAQANRK